MSIADLSIHAMRVGAEVAGFAEGMEADPEVRQALYQAWLDHGILLFRNVGSTAQHLAISRCFGDLEIHPVPEVRSAENPYLIELGVRMSGMGRPPTVYVFDDDQMRINRIAWHRDTAYTPDICKGAMLRMIEVPREEGETLLADTAKAWDDLPADLKARLEQLEFRATIRTAHMNTIGRPGVFWKSVRLASEEEFPGNAERSGRDGAIDARYPSVVHPAVLTHPESGRKCIFLSPTYVDFFLGMDQRESDALLWRLTEHMLKPDYVYRHGWRASDAIVWDNRRFMHAGMGNRPGEPRFGLRTTLAGPLRTGRYFDENAEPAPAPLAD
jgi:taurine dioxygenase